MYNNAFSNLPVLCPAEPEKDTVHARHLYTLLIDIDKTKKTRDRVQQELHGLNIGTGIHFISLHLHDYYRKTYGYKPDDFPNATWISERTISLPLSPKLSVEDVEDVINAVTNIVL
jgi:dTDP-4-amino-4,6-dideoxygalactose transaminase